MCAGNTPTETKIECDVESVDETTVYAIAWIAEETGVLTSFPRSMFIGWHPLVGHSFYWFMESQRITQRTWDNAELLDEIRERLENLEPLRIDQ